MRRVTRASGKGRSMTTATRSSGAEKRPGWLPLLAGLALLLVCPLASYHADFDLWGHLTFGEEMIRSGEIIRGDPYSFTASGRIETRHEWLSEVWMAAAWEAGGRRGLWLYASSLILLLSLVLLSMLRQRTERAVVALLLLGVFLAFLGVGRSVRPHLHSYLNAALLVALLGRVEAGPRGRLLWFVPPLFALWANLHGGFLAGLGILAVYSAVAIVRKRPFRATLAVVFGVSAVATLANPYGPGLWAFLASSLSTPRGEIAEWKSVLADYSLSRFVLSVILLVLGSVLFRRERMRPPEIACFFFTSIFAVLHIKHIPFAALFWVILLAPSIDGSLSVVGRKEDRAGRVIGKAVRILLGFFLAVMILRGPARVLTSSLKGDRGVAVSTADYPIAAVSFMREANLSGNVICHFNWGEFLIATLYPECRVSIDGRYRTVYPNRVLDQHFDWLRGREAGHELLRREDADMILTYSASKKGREMVEEGGGWVSVYEDPVSVLYMRAGDPAMERAEAEAERREPAALPAFLPFDLHGANFGSP